MQAQVGEVSFVFGSDTSTPGISVTRRSTHYHASGINLYASPTANAARIMDAAYRAQYVDSYGTPFPMTWWMNVGSLYRSAENTNVPVPSVMSTYLMQQYHGPALEALGDELTFHYHSWVWSDDDGDGVYFWNQARHFAAFAEDFERTMAEHLIASGVYPASFRSGWHYMDNAWQQYLDDWIPFSLHNDSPHRHEDFAEPIDNLYDWSRAPQDFVPYQPHPDDYQRPGGDRGWNVRSRSMRGTTEALLEALFAAARAGTDQVFCIWDHLAAPTFLGDLEAVFARIEAVSARYPDVPFRYETAVAAMQRWLGTADQTPPTLTLTPVPAGDAVRLRITTDEPIFQTTPFVATKDRYARHARLAVQATGPLTWETVDTYDPTALAQVAVAVTDTVGNIAQDRIAYLPGELFLDDTDPGYAETAGTWSALSNVAVDQAWGTGVRRASLAAGSTAEAQWQTTLATADPYQVFIRFPDLKTPAAPTHYAVYLDGALVDSTTFAAPQETYRWLYLATVAGQPGSTVTVTVAATGRTGEEALGADVVKLSPLVPDQLLYLDKPSYDFGDRIHDDPAPVTVFVQNLGTEPLTITGLRSIGGAVRSTHALPLTLAPLTHTRLPFVFEVPTRGEVQDTLLIESDDPVAPRRRVPVRANLRGYFTVADNDDAVGYEEVGAWQTSVTQAHGVSSRYIGVAGAASASATFTLTPSEAGIYDLAFIIPKSTNSALRADYTVSINGAATAPQRRDQNAGSGTWQSLGTFPLQPGDAVSVRLTVPDIDQQNRVLRADAVRLSRLGSRLEEVVLDNGADGYRETGPWQESVAQAYGTSSRYAAYGSGARAYYVFTPTHTNLHTLYAIVPTTVNATTQAQYRVLVDGVPVDSVVIDQNVGSGAWRSLGQWSFAAGAAVEVEVRDRATQASPRVLRTDALKWVFGVDGSVGTHTETLPPALTLEPNYPNPFRGPTHFAFTLAQPGPAEVVLFDLLGRRVATLATGPHPAGRHAYRFDGRSLPSGVYLCRLAAAGQIRYQTWLRVR